MRPRRRNFLLIFFLFQMSNLITFFHHRHVRGQCFSGKDISGMKQPNLDTTNDITTCLMKSNFAEQTF